MYTCTSNFDGSASRTIDMMIDTRAALTRQLVVMIRARRAAASLCLIERMNCGIHRLLVVGDIIRGRGAARDATPGGCHALKGIVFEAVLVLQLVGVKTHPICSLVSYRKRTSSIIRVMPNRARNSKKRTPDLICVPKT